MRSYFLRPPIFARSLMPQATWNLGDRKNEVNLSIDDGPHPVATPLILNLLSAHKVKVTFFLLGDQVEKFPSLYQEIKSEGHQIGTHGYHHIDGWRTNNKVYIKNALKGADITESNLFRPPYGRISFRQYQKLSNQLRLVMWSLMTGDFDPDVSTAIHTKRLKTHCRGGDILVFHDQVRAASMLIEGFEDFTNVIKKQNWSFSLL